MEHNDASSPEPRTKVPMWARDIVSTNSESARLVTHDVNGEGHYVEWVVVAGNRCSDRRMVQYNPGFVSLPINTLAEAEAMCARLWQRWEWVTIEEHKTLVKYRTVTRSVPLTQVDPVTPMQRPLSAKDFQFLRRRAGNVEGSFDGKHWQLIADQSEAEQELRTRDGNGRVKR